jgi:hypothetical protein
MNLCPRCGKDLDTIPEQYRDFVHLDKQRLWCVDFGNISPELQQCIDEVVERLVRNMRETLDRIMVEGA